MDPQEPSTLTVDHLSPQKSSSNSCNASRLCTSPLPHTSMASLSGRSSAQDHPQHHPRCQIHPQRPTAQTVINAYQFPMPIPHNKTIHCPDKPSTPFDMEQVRNYLLSKKQLQEHYFDHFHNVKTPFTAKHMPGSSLPFPSQPEVIHPQSHHWQGHDTLQLNSQGTGQAVS